MGKQVISQEWEALVKRMKAPEKRARRIKSLSFLRDRVFIICWVSE
jgi:hypothetical protein